MADIMIEIFGDALELPTEIDDGTLTEYPSPIELVNKFLIKGKRVHKVEDEESADEETDFDHDDESVQSDDAFSPASPQEGSPASTNGTPDSEKKRRSSRKSLKKKSSFLNSPTEKAPKHKVSQKLSDITYLCATTYKDTFAKEWYKMHSFSELKLEKLAKTNTAALIHFNRTNFSRIYPKGTRFSSTNYDPAQSWVTGCQMVALNYQTHDRGMRLNQIKFSENGRCGYLLKPERLRNKEQQIDFTNTKAEQRITITIISAEHLPKPNESTKGEVVDPFVKLSLYGPGADSSVMLKTQAMWNNGFNPVWNERFEIDVHHWDLSILRLAVYDKNSVSDDIFLCENVLPVNKLRTGVRCVPLRNNEAKVIDACHLLVDIKIGPIVEQTSVDSNDEQVRLLRDENLKLKQLVEQLQKDKEESKANGFVTLDREELKAIFEKQDKRLTAIETQLRLLARPASHSAQSSVDLETQSPATPREEFLHIKDQHTREIVGKLSKVNSHLRVVSAIFDEPSAVDKAISANVKEIETVITQLATEDAEKKVLPVSPLSPKTTTLKSSPVKKAPMSPNTSRSKLTSSANKLT
jgi:hypothetical protein